LLKKVPKDIKLLKKKKLLLKDTDIELSRKYDNEIQKLEAVLSNSYEIDRFSVRIIIKLEYWLRNFNESVRNSPTQKEKIFKSFQQRIKDYLLMFISYSDYYKNHYNVYLKSIKVFRKYESVIITSIREWINNESSIIRRINNSKTRLFKDWLTHMNQIYSLSNN
jgi:hypothetical protein